MVYVVCEVIVILGVIGMVLIVVFVEEFEGLVDDVGVCEW